MPWGFRNGRASSSSAGVWASACSCSGSNGGNMWPAIEEMTIPAPPGAITRPNSSSTSAVPSRSTARDRRRGRLDGRDAGGVDDVGDGAQRGGFLGEGVHRFARGDVDALGADAVAEVLQRGGGRGLVVLADVGEENVL